LLVALEEVANPPTTVLLRGDPATCASWQRQFERVYRPGVRSLDLARADALPGALSRPHAGDHAATAWVCRGTACLPPMHALEDVIAALGTAP
jgi:uncharacterized protein YyaL (SSP411 family)